MAKIRLFFAFNTSLSTFLTPPLCEEGSENRFVRFIEVQTDEHDKDEINCYGKEPAGYITIKAPIVDSVESKEAHQYSAPEINKNIYKVGILIKMQLIKTTFVEHQVFRLQVGYTQNTTME